MFAKNKITQSMIDAVNSIIGEDSKVSKPIQLDENKGSGPQETFTDNNPECGVEPKMKKLKKEALEVSKAADPEEVTTDMLKGRVKGGKINSFKSFKLQLKTDGEMKAPIEKEPTISTKAQSSVAPHETSPSNVRFDPKLAKPTPQDKVSEAMEKSPAKNTDLVDTKSKMDRLKDTKSGALHNVGKGIKAFLKGKPEPMESVDLEGEELSEEVIDDILMETLSKKADAGAWIKDFMDSDNPKFAGKSPAKRKQMALAAYYAKQRNEEVDLEESIISDNPNNGYHGTQMHFGHDHAAKNYASFHKSVKNIAKKHGIISKHDDGDHLVKKFLDSRHGRHLDGYEHDTKQIVQRLHSFHKEINEEVEPLNEDGVLDMYLRSRGLNPKLVPRDKKVAYAKSPEFQKYKASHAGGAKMVKIESIELDEGKKSPTLGTKLIKKYGEGDHTAEVRHNAQWNDYQVHHYYKGVHKGEGPVSYHYDDKEDAHNTAKHETDRLNKMQQEEVKTPMDRVKEVAKHSFKKMRKEMLGKISN